MLAGYYIIVMKEMFDNKEIGKLSREYLQSKGINSTEEQLSVETKKDVAKYLTDIVDKRAKELYNRDNNL